MEKEIHLWVRESFPGTVTELQDQGSVQIYEFGFGITNVRGMAAKTD